MVLYYSKIPYTDLYCNIIYYRNYNICYCIAIELYCSVIQYNMYYNSIVLYCDTVQIVALGIYRNRTGIHYRCYHNISGIVLSWYCIIVKYHILPCIVI